MTFKVLSYNIRLGGEDRLHLITEVLLAQQPDAVALVEANSQVNVEALADALGVHFVYGQANSEFAIAWLSHLPIEYRKNHRLKVLAKTLLEVNIVWKGAGLSLFATHLVDGRTATAAQQRAVEVQAILQVLHPLTDRSHLLVGDFNAIHPDDPIGTPPSGEKKGHVARRPIQLILETGYMDCYRERHADVPGYTYTSHHPWLRLDYVFASPEMAARLCTCGVVAGREARQASDHLPIWAEFK